MRMTRLHVGLVSAIAALSLAAVSSAAVMLNPLASFGTNGYLAPGDRAYLTTDNNQRGLAYNSVSGNVLLVNRTGGLSINILNGTTGADGGALNQGSGVISGGTFTGSMIGTGDDGAIYLANLTTNATTSPFKVYRWANEAATPTTAFSGAPLAGARLGDTLDVMGSGTGTQIVAGYNSGPAVAGNNSFARLSTADGDNYTGEHIAVGTDPPAAGDFRLGITFQDSNTVLGRQVEPGRIVDITGPGTGSLFGSFTLDGSAIRPMDYALVGGTPILAAVETNTSRLFVYDMTDPVNPVNLAVGTTLTNASNANANGVGQVKFGAIGDTSAIIYALNTNNGIQAFEITGVPEPSSWLLMAVSACGLVAFARRKRS